MNRHPSCTSIVDERPSVKRIKSCATMREHGIEKVKRSVVSGTQRSVDCLAWKRLLGLGLLNWLLLAGTLAAQPREYFGIQLVDAETGRGIPMVELRTTNDLLFVTDSGGWVAFDEPGLLGQKVFFHVSSHGYEYPEDFLGQRGLSLETSPGGRAKIELQRSNIAERLYRVTGQGIYSDSARLGEPMPLTHPLLSGKVTGQDSVQNAQIGDTLYWFWGDTNRPSYPLGHFGTSVARSRLPSGNGLEPSVGVNLEYYVDENGFSQPAFDSEGGIVVWLDGVMVVRDDQDRDRIVGHYSVMKSLGERLEHGLAVFDPKSGKFKKMLQWPDSARLEPHGHIIRESTDDVEYFYFCNPFPTTRVRANWDAIQDPDQYQAWTPLAQGASFQGGKTRLEMDVDNHVVFAWKHDTLPLKPGEESDLVTQGLLKPDEAHWLVKSPDSTTDVLLHSGTVAYNRFRDKFVLIAVETFGKPSFLGEVWYAEADTLEGPWRSVVKIVTHSDYSFYNPRHHPYFDSDDGRFIYFEGTYTSTFSQAKSRTPRYDYNQVMYRLDLADPRLQPAAGDD